MPTIHFFFHQTSEGPTLNNLTGKNQNKKELKGFYKFFLSFFEQNYPSCSSPLRRPPGFIPTASPTDTSPLGLHGALKRCHVSPDTKDKIFFLA